jgi:orotidine-5'-phosphate decarboxylase
VRASFVPGQGVTQGGFAERLAAAVEAKRSQLVVGLDPEPAQLLPSAVERAGDGSPAERAARAVAAHCAALVEALAPTCVAVKLQVACFERLGAPGWDALAATAGAARAAGLLVIADGKRGDVPHTAAAYAQGLLGATPTPWGPVEGLGADAVTLNPLLGRDALEPFVDAARARGAGVFVLVRTSNPGAASVQDEPAEAPLRLRLAKLVDELGGSGPGLSDVGAVVAATAPELVAELRSAMPRATFLLPGVGAQGGSVDLLSAAFAPGPSGALVTASRSLVNPALESGEARASVAAAEELRATTWNLRGR